MSGAYTRPELSPDDKDKLKRVYDDLLDLTMSEVPAVAAASRRPWPRWRPRSAARASTTSSTPNVGASCMSGNKVVNGSANQGPGRVTQHGCLP